MVNDLCKLRSERAGGGELVPDEVAGGDVRDADEARQPGGVGPLADAGAAEEDPLAVPPLGAPLQRELLRAAAGARSELAPGAEASRDDRRGPRQHEPLQDGHWVGGRARERERERIAVDGSSLPGSVGGW